MTESAVAYPTRPSNRTFWAAGALGILATAVGAILPVLVGVWQKQAGLQVDQAGFVAATELFAQVAGTGVFLWASPRWTLRTIAVVVVSGSRSGVPGSTDSLRVLRIEQ